MVYYTLTIIIHLSALQHCFLFTNYTRNMYIIIMVAEKGIPALRQYSTARACRPPAARPSPACLRPSPACLRLSPACRARQGPDRYQTFNIIIIIIIILLLKILKFILDSEHAYASLARIMAAESVLTRTRKLL